MKFIQILILVCTPSLLFAQISRNQWLVGGGFSGKFETSSTDSYKEIDLITQIDAGYFVINKLSVGIRGEQRYTSHSFPAGGISAQRLSFAVGPFVRYYLLPAANRFNFYSELYYGYGASKTKQNSSGFGEAKMKNNTYNVNLAPVYMVNQHVSVQLVLGYYFQTYAKASVNYTDITLGFGLQVHLGRSRE